MVQGSGRPGPGVEQDEVAVLLTFRVTFHVTGAGVGRPHVERDQINDPIRRAMVPRRDVVIVSRGADEAEPYRTNPHR